jgi:deoxyribose-phosphate aldolase
LTLADIALMIDHSLLRPDISTQELHEGFEVAKKYRAATVCVRPYDIELAVRETAGSDVKVSTTVAFPHGANLTSTKVYEAEKAMGLGVFELDLVLAVGRLISDDYDYVREDIHAVVEAAHARDAVVKVILDNVYLSSDQIARGCEICEEVGADYVKTSSGYSPGGATLEDVRLMRASCSEAVSVKAAGGIRTLDQLLEYRAAGARMIGTRSTKEILEEAEIREREGTLFEIHA